MNQIQRRIALTTPWSLVFAKTPYSGRATRQTMEGVLDEMIWMCDEALAYDPLKPVLRQARYREMLEPVLRQARYREMLEQSAVSATTYVFR